MASLYAKIWIVVLSHTFCVLHMYILNELGLLMCAL